HVAVHVIATFTLLFAATRPASAQMLAPLTPAAPPIREIIFLSPATLAAEPSPPPEPGPDLWNFAAEFSYTDQTGNKTLRLLTGGLKFSHRDKKRFELDGSLQSRYGQSEGEVVSRNYFSTINFSPYKE